VVRYGRYFVARPPAEKPTGDAEKDSGKYNLAVEELKAPDDIMKFRIRSPVEFIPDFRILSCVCGNIVADIKLGVFFLGELLSSRTNRCR
jgi:hypothetical protein